MLLSQKNPCYIGDTIAERTPKKKTGRGKKSLSPSVRDNCRLRVKFGSQGDQTGTGKFRVSF